MFGNLEGARSSDRSTSSGYACVSVALVLGILELRQVFIVLLCKISLSGVVEINIMRVLIGPTMSLCTGALEHHFRGPRASS